MTVKHAKQTGLPADAGNPAEVEPSDWYADHVVTGTPPGVFVGCKALRTSDFTGIANTTDTPIPWNAANVFDTNGFHDPSTNNTRITIPAGYDGKYLVTAGSIWDSNTSNERQIWIRKNGTTPVSDLIFNNAAANLSQQVVAVLDLVAGDYLETIVWQNSGGSRSLQFSIWGASTFSITMLNGGSSAAVGGPVSVVPDMWSNSWLGYTASASETYVASHPWEPFVGSPGTGFHGWLSNGSALPQWFRIELPSAVAAIAYAVMPWWIDNYPSRTPQTWTFEGSNNGSSWSVLDTQTGFTSWLGSTAFNLFTLANATAYRYYRLNISANRGDTYTGVGGLRIYAAAASGTASPTAGSNLYAFNSLI